MDDEADSTREEEEEVEVVAEVEVEQHSPTEEARGAFLPSVRNGRVISNRSIGCSGGRSILTPALALLSA